MGRGRSAALGRGRKTWVLVGLGASLAAAALFPLVPILVGTAILVAIALHALASDLRPFLQPVLRPPVGARSLRVAHFAMLCAVGVLLLGVGAVSSTARGHLLSSWEQDQTRRTAARQDGERLLERARECLDRGEVQAAELELMGVDRLAVVTPELKAEIEELLARVRGAGDAQAILGVLVGLSDADFAAFETKRVVPAQFEHPERALTMRAVATALEQLDAARRLRARR